MSQEEFADRTGSNRAYYGDVERGKRNLTLKSLDKIAEGLGVSIVVLFQEALALRTSAKARKDK